MFRKAVIKNLMKSFLISNSSLSEAPFKLDSSSFYVLWALFCLQHRWLDADFWGTTEDAQGMLRRSVVRIAHTKSNSLLF